MASDPTDLPAAGTDGDLAAADGTLQDTAQDTAPRHGALQDGPPQDPTQGVPIVPGVPFLPGVMPSTPDPSASAASTALPTGLSSDASRAGGAGRVTADTARSADTGWVPSGARSTTTSAPGTEPEGAGVTGAVHTGPGAERTSRRDKDLGPEPASSLTADRLLAGASRPPASGWRRWLFTATFGRVNLGDSDAIRVQRALEHRISVRLGGRTRYVPVLSRKGGVGKTTVTTLLGMALADIREDRIIAMDANPDRGTLSDRSPGRADHTARQLVRNRHTIESFSQLAAFVTRDGSRLHVLASDTDPSVAQAFDDSDYRAVTDLLSRYYSIVLTDSGTGMVHSVMKGTLDKADSVVLVSGGSVDEARLASETLSWLEAHGRHDLVARAIVVINLSSGNGTQVDVEQIEQHFRSRVNTVVRIPYDRHLAEGSRIELARLNPASRRAVTELAALVVDQLAS